MLYRVFPHLPGRRPGDEGGPLHVPRARQGAGRHDSPDRYGALYASRSPVAAVAERIQAFRGQRLDEGDLRRRSGAHAAIVALDDAGLDLVDLDDPAELVRRRLRPSGVATRERDVTQRSARSIHRDGVDGFTWWSTLEASWINATLFAERASPRLRLASEHEPLSLSHPALRDAADVLGIRLS